MHKAGLEPIADNAVDAPLYTLCEAARYLHLPNGSLIDPNGPRRDQDSMSFRRLALADDYDLTTPEVEEAIRYELLSSDLSRLIQ